MATVGSDQKLDGCSPRAIEDNQSVIQIDKISQEPSNFSDDDEFATDDDDYSNERLISVHEWSNSVDSYVEDTNPPQIQKIPSFLRDEPSNKKCYEPLIVSIGPYHHGKKKLKAFEELKISVAQNFVRACFNQVSTQQLCEEVAKVGKSARKCYEKVCTVGYNDVLFNKMMFLDACFVLQIICRFSERKSIYMEVEPLPKPWKSCLPPVSRDLFLLENQIPLLVLKVLMKYRFKNESEGTEVIHQFLATIMLPQERTSTNAVKKFVQRMMGCSDQKKEERKLDTDAPHLLHLLREQLIGSSPEDKNNEKPLTWTSYRSVKELKSAGIHFRQSETNHVTDVKFKSHLIYGTLTLPPIMVDDSTKPWLLNLAAYEMCTHGPSDARIMSYIGLMDSFIDHADDVKELRKKSIIVNYLHSDDYLAKLFNEIGNGLVFDHLKYADVKWKIENHCKSKAQVWMAEWINNHFSSPWAFLAFLGAIFVIALTAVQTNFAVLSYEASRH